MQSIILQKCSKSPNNSVCDPWEITEALFQHKGFFHLLFCSQIKGSESVISCFGSFLVSASFLMYAKAGEDADAFGLAGLPDEPGVTQLSPEVPLNAARVRQGLGGDNPTTWLQPSAWQMIKCLTYASIAPSGRGARMPARASCPQTVSGLHWTWHLDAFNDGSEVLLMMSTAILQVSGWSIHLVLQVDH